LLCNLFVGGPFQGVFVQKKRRIIEKLSVGDVPEKPGAIARSSRSLVANSQGNNAKSKTVVTNQHLRTRRDHASETAEDYVEAIASIEATGTECRLKDLSAHFGVSHVTASKILARLSREGLVETKPYSPVRLSEQGLAMAKVARQRHQLVLDFLIALGVTAGTAQIDAEGIEHHVSDETIRCIKKFLSSKA
jgi:DtxR family manganese transport transcriptional regulator